MIAGGSHDSVGFTGVPSRAELEASPGFTPEEWLRAGPKAVIECVQEIPCNPCEKVCPRGAITVGEPITRLPRIDPSRCVGCGICIPACPGQAIFLVDMSREGRAMVSFPWEYLPEPQCGDRVVACGREGEPVCEATVVRVVCPRNYDRTRVVTLAVPVEYGSRVRSMLRSASRSPSGARTCGDGGECRRSPRSEGGEVGKGDDTIICRCEEVTLGDVRQAVADGATTLGAVRRWTRAGMGLCQGRTCRRLVMQELERATGVRPGGAVRETARAPVGPVTLAVLAAEDTSGAGEARTSDG